MLVRNVDCGGVVRGTIDCRTKLCLTVEMKERGLGSDLSIQRLTVEVNILITRTKMILRQIEKRWWLNVWGTHLRLTLDCKGRRQAQKEARVAPGLGFWVGSPCVHRHRA